jgi:ABC-type transport system involved in multi-copper enzyme maturation permease subunit
MRLWAVASNTFKETIRNRVLVNILLFAVALILLSLVVGEWSLGNQAKVIKDFGLAAMSLFGLLIAIFIGIRLMVQEVEQRTVYLILSKPIRRWEFVLGKYLGLSCTLALNVLLMSVTLWAVVLVQEGRIDFGLAPAILLIYMEIGLIVAFALLFSTFTSPTLSALFTLVIFVIGHTASFLRDFILLYPDKPLLWLLKAIYTVMPNLENLNLKMAAVEHLATQPHAVLFGFLYGFGYTAFVLILTILVFENKDLK